MSDCSELINRILSFFSLPETKKEIDSTLSDLVYKIVGRFRLSIRKKRLSDDLEYQRFREQTLLESNSIPEELRLPLDTSIASFALDSAKFSLDSPQLSNMFSQLIASSQNSKYADYNHIAFVEILRQLSSYDAMLLQDIFHSASIPACVVRRAEDPGYNDLVVTVQNFLGPDKDDLQAFDQSLMPNGKNISSDYILLNETVLSDTRTAVSLGNLSRLGLIVIDYSVGSYSEKLYAPFFENPEIKSVLDTSTNVNPVALVFGTCELTTFGLGFAMVCLDGGNKQIS